MLPVFDIFSGRFGEKKIVWLGVVEGSEAAWDRMLQLAAKEPGPSWPLLLPSVSCLAQKRRRQ
jgi:hypothetical protein